LGAPAAHKAAAAATQQQQQDQQGSAVCMPLWQQIHPHQPNSIAALTGIPVRVTHTASDTSSSSSSSNVPGATALQQQPHAPAVVCSADLDWQGSASEARLVAGLGLTQAVERALAQMERDAAGGAAAANTGAAAAMPLGSRAAR
jgi:hypothetical protein